MKFTAQRFFFLLAMLAGVLGSVNAAPTLTITPQAVSNTYIGPITLQISNVPAGDTVVIQKYGDVITNGMIAPGDVLVQQFNLTDGQAGMVIGGVTNIDVPGDTDGSTNGQITAILPFPGGDFVQQVIGQYGFVLSSPVGHFTPVTNFFTVTNFPFAQQITGTVFSNGVSAPYATVILFPAPRPGHNGPGTPLAGTVANSSGVYRILVPPGTYVPLAFQSNFVGNYSASPVLTLTNMQTVTTNLALTNATASISGTIVDALNPSIVLPGLFVPANNNSGYIPSGSSDTNGNFTIRVLSGQWKLSGNPEGLAVHGYVSYNNGTNLSAGTTGFVGGFYKATALFYGTVKDNLGSPLPGIDIGARDNGEFGNDGYSDANGNYVVGAVGGLGSGDPWQIQVANGSDVNNPTNYLFSQAAVDQNGGTNLATNSAVLQNFTAILATNQITGHVQYNGSPVGGVQVFAYATIGGNNYQAEMDTDTNGNYSLYVANSNNWNVNVYDCGCSDSDSLNNILTNGNFQPPNGQNVGITNNNGTANFTIQPCSGIQILTTSPLPNGTNGDYYSIQFAASSCNGNFNWSVNDPQDLPPGLTLYSGGAFNGTSTSTGIYNFSVNVTDGASNSTNQLFSLTIVGSSAPLQIMTTSLPNGTNGVFYSQTFQASGGTPPYNWFIPNFSASPPPALTFTTNGVLSGTPSTTAGNYYFDVIVTDAAAHTNEEDGLVLTIVNPPLAPLVITNVSLPNGTVGTVYSAQLGATGGQPPYGWSLALGSANPPPGLTLNSSGLISGTPTNSGLFSFKVQVTDMNSTTTNKLLSITVNSAAKPVISSPAHLPGNQFQMLLNGVANQNYTLQMSTNLGTTNWMTLYVTNNPATNSFLLTDPGATNKQRFYRILVGP